MCRFEHPIKGQGIYAYVQLAKGVDRSAEVKKELNSVVRQQIGAFAAPDVIHWVPGMFASIAGVGCRVACSNISSEAV